MYQPGDRFMYGAHGVCEILAIEQKKIDRKTVEYYVLSPVGNTKVCFYIPTQNSKALAKLNPLLTVAELQKLLIKCAESQDVWIDDENARKQCFKAVIASCDQTEMIRWVRSLHIHRRILLENGKKFHQVDESFLKDAEKILITEFAIVLNISEDSVVQYVRDLVVAKSAK